MEVKEILEYFIGVLIPGLVVWMFRMQQHMSNLDKELAVNTSKDDRIWKDIEEIKSELKPMAESIAQIKAKLEI